MNPAWYRTMRKANYKGTRVQHPQADRDCEYPGAKDRARSPGLRCQTSGIAQGRSTLRPFPAAHREATQGSRPLTMRRLSAAGALRARRDDLIDPSRVWDCVTGTTQASGKGLR